MSKILIGYSACPLTRAAFEAHGHDVWTGDLPKLTHTEQVAPRWVRGKNGVLPRWANQTDSGQNNLSPGDDRWLQRSATYPGIAAAMGDQWGRYMLELDAVKVADNDNSSALQEKAS